MPVHTQALPTCSPWQLCTNYLATTITADTRIPYTFKTHSCTSRMAQDETHDMAWLPERQARYGMLRRVVTVFIHTAGPRSQLEGSQQTARQVKVFRLCFICTRFTKWESVLHIFRQYMSVTISVHLLSVSWKFTQTSPQVPIGDLLAVNTVLSIFLVVQVLFNGQVY